MKQKLNLSAFVNKLRWYLMKSSIKEILKESNIDLNNSDVNKIINAVDEFYSGNNKSKLIQIIDELENSNENYKFALQEKFSQIEHQTISYQVGSFLTDFFKSPRREVSKLPRKISIIVSEVFRRRSGFRRLSKIEKIMWVLTDKNIEVSKIVKIRPEEVFSKNTKTIHKIGASKVIAKEEKTISIDRSKRVKVDIKNKLPQIEFEYIKQFWLNKKSKIRLITILDEISDLSWSQEFKLYPINKNSFKNQISNSNSNAMFIESCWKGNQGTWEFAFTSPGLKHKNAQDLLTALDTARDRNLPILFWNKEDPMHYEKFLPIAKKCDIIFTTDINKVEHYKKDLNHENVFSLPFAANPYICNPLNRARYEQEDLCFAGSYYSVGHDDRKVQMDKLLPTLLDCNGVIYDRMSKLNNDRYAFPQNYQNIIRDAVDFREMTALYKHFKLFLNVNTITDSPTMMSRRVYELLACGTPVISTPSLALEKQFSGIVQIANNEKEAKKIVTKLLNNHWEYSRISHLGYREVMLKHTYEERKITICQSLGLNTTNEIPLVSIILPTMRPHFIDRIIDNIGQQTYSNIECIIIVQDYSPEEVEKLESKLYSIKAIQKVQIITNNSSDTLGARLNQAVALSSGEYIAKFDDDDFYFPNYLTDMMIPFKFGNWSIVGKKEGFFYIEAEDKTIVKYPGQRHLQTDFVMGATLVIRKSDLLEVGGFEAKNRGEDSNLLKAFKEKGKYIYAADPFNFVVWRSKDSSSHSWDINPEFYKLNCDFVSHGLQELIVKL